MKVLAVCAALTAVAATLPPGDSGFTVHEWGTFTSVAAENGSAAQWYALGCGGDLPDFVNFEQFRDWKLTLGGTVRMETPVMYFYSPRELEASVKVSFPNGLMTEWYPSADNEIFRQVSGQSFRLLPNRSGINLSMTNQTGVLEWKSVRVQPHGSADFPIGRTPGRYYAARATGAAPLAVGNQHEKFLFYRGVANIQVPLLARVADDGGVIVEAEGPVSVGDIYFFENRSGVVGYRKAERLNGQSTKLDRPELRFTTTQLKADLESTLITAGLYPKEAAAMINTWRDSWFEEGSRLIYVLPTSTVDKMLPLEVSPKPAKIERVFVGRIELVTPETKRIAKQAVAGNDAHTHVAYQRFLDPILKSIGVPSGNFASRSRCGQ